MVRLSRLASMLTRSGRLESRARRWDAIADAAAIKRKFHADQWLSLSYMGRHEQANENMFDAEMAHMTEQNARDMARQLRASK
jgi:hypothetical protein